MELIQNRIGNGSVSVFSNIDIFECREGDIVATDIYSNDGRTLLLAKETILNEYIIKRLENMDIRRVRIYKKAEHYGLSEKPMVSQELPPNQVISLMKNMFQNIVSGKDIASENLSAITDQIYGSLKDSHTVEQCLKNIRSSDEYTYGHSINVAFYAMMIGRGLKLSESEVQKAFLSGLLHDIGKTQVPEEILNKPGKLDSWELEIIQNHTIMGNIIVDMIYGLDQDIKNAVLLHHERMDGSGYPFQFTKRNINLYSGIVAAADVFDAMTTDRVYMSRRTPFDVFKMFLSDGLGKFDIQIIDVFTKKLANNMIGCKVLLNTGETGEIAYIPYHKPMHPILKLSEEYIDLSEDRKKKIVRML